MERVRRTTLLPVAFLWVFALIVAAPSHAQESKPATRAEIDVAANIKKLVSPSVVSQRLAMKAFEDQWQIAFAPMLLESLRVIRNGSLQRDIIQLLQKKTGQELGFQINRWFDWIWKQKIKPHPAYLEVKSLLYQRLDGRFARYFENGHKSIIQLDEIRWGGVQQNGIPPLRQPKMIPVSQAQYLADSDVVFGISINGDVRAYPKRILAWHEMFIDKVGGVAFTGVY